MMQATAIQSATNLLMQLANPAARALALAAAAGLALTAFRVRTTSVRLFTWTAVLYAALAMPLLGRMLPPLPLPAPAFLQSGSLRSEVMRPSPKAGELVQPAAQVKVRTAHNLAVKTTSSTEFTYALSTPAIQAAPSSPAWSLIPWKSVAAGIYLAVAFLLLLRFFVGLAFSRRLMRASQIINDPRMTQRLTARAYAAGLTFIPPAAESEFISVPVTMGALRSTILLPASWREWDNLKIDAVVAHEMSHVARRDAVTQRLSLLHRAIFWFSPLAWWLDRHLADLAEQASDEAALSCGADRQHYARTLLGFFEALHAAPGRVWWQGVSMAKVGQAEQRLERILTWKGSVAMRLKKSIAVVVITLAVPVVYLAAAARLAAHVVDPTGPELAQTQLINVQLAQVRLTQDQTPPPAPVAVPAPAPAPRARVDVTPPPTPAIVPRAAVHVYSPMAPTAHLAPMAPMPPAAHYSQSYGSGSSYGHGSSYAYGYDDDQRFIIVSGKSDSLTMSGTGDDAKMVEELKKTIPGDFIWFERSGKSYVIRDQATIDRARAFWAPQEELGKKQEELGKQQEALGKQQEELGEKMEQVRVNVPDMTAELDKLRAELKQLSSGATMDQVGHLQEEIGELQEKIGELQSHAGDQQGKLGEEMGALGEKQGKLGEQQGKLGEQQGKLAEQANRQMKQLLTDSITKGTAQPQK